MFMYIGALQKWLPSESFLNFKIKEYRFKQEIRPWFMARIMNKKRFCYSAKQLDIYNDSFCTTSMSFKG